MPELAWWQWMLGVLSAIGFGIAKTGVPGLGAMVSPLMVMAVGDARHAAAWTAPLLSTGDIFAIMYWRWHAEAKHLFSLAPWVGGGMAIGAVALGLSEPVLRHMIGVIVLAMVILFFIRRMGIAARISRSGPMFGVCTGFASVVANAAGPVMNMYLLSRKLPKEQFIATGAWFFLFINLLKMPVYAFYGLFSRSSMAYDLMMVPAVVCGAYVGLWIVRRMPQHVFDNAVIILTAVTALLLFR